MKKKNTHQCNNTIAILFSRVFLFIIFMSMFVWSSTIPYTNGKRQIIILKADDVVYSPISKRFTDYIEQHGMKASLGIVAKFLVNEDTCQWLKSLAQKSNFEIWNHGLVHDCNDSTESEFMGNPYEVQLANILESQRLFKERIGLTCTVWGAPCNMVDENTARALSEIPEINTWYYGKFVNRQFIIERYGNIEFPTGYPNYDAFVEKYNKDNLGKYSYIAFQLHPEWWNDKYWVELEKIFDFLNKRNVVYMNPSEYIQSITDTITVEETTDNGPHSLRAAISKANILQTKRTVIILPPGTYRLSGAPGEDKNVSGDLDIISNVEIIGADPSKTIIDANGNDRAFHIMDCKVNISGVTIRNGKAFNGGGIKIENGNVTILDSIICDNQAIDSGDQKESGGSGIFSLGSRITISRCTIRNNSGYSKSQARGGGIWITTYDDSRPVEIRNTLFEGNAANTCPSSFGTGGAVYIHTVELDSQVFLYGNTFRNNTASTNGPGNGGGIFCRKLHSVILEKNRFSGNCASITGKGWGGGLYIDDNVTIRCINNLIVENSAPSGGDGLYLEGTASGEKISPVTCTLFQNTIANNKNSKGSDGINAGNYVFLDFQNNVISGHTRGVYQNNSTGTGKITGDYNLLFNTNDPITGTHFLKQDPLLSAEFKPFSNSPVIDSGKVIPGILTDIEGNSHYECKGFDLGCYKYIPEPVSQPFIGRKALYFGSGNQGTTSAQAVPIYNMGSSIMDWNARTDSSWITVSPSKGTGSSTILVEIDPAGLKEGMYKGTIQVRDSNNINSNQTISVTLNNYKNGITVAPEGAFFTPGEGTTGVTGDIPLSGWALDDIEVDKVEIHYEKEGKMEYIGDAWFVDDVRPDIELSHPSHPLNYRSGWGYVLMTRLLPSQGTGTYRIQAIAVDKEGNHTPLGTRTISCDNSHAVKPFGSIETPAPGETSSNQNYVNWGWALTPSPSKIPVDGSTIRVVVDGIQMGTPVYNIKREDISHIFPGLKNSDGAIGYYKLDTTVFKDGFHSIQWIVSDDSGNTDGVGCRFFRVKNKSRLFRVSTNRLSPLPHSPILDSEIKKATRDISSLSITSGSIDKSNRMTISPDSKGTFHIKSVELGNIEIKLSDDSIDMKGFMEVGTEWKPLPPGSNLGLKKGSFTWQPGPGVSGKYSLVLFVKEKNNTVKRRDISIEIKEKFSK